VALQVAVHLNEGMETLKMTRNLW